MFYLWIFYPNAIASAVASSAVYVNTSDAGILFIVPPSFTIIPSLSASVIELPTDVSPSNKFSSEVVTVAPSNISNSASDISAEPITIPDAVKVPTIKFAAAYPVALIFTVVDGSVCVSVNNLNVLSVDASKKYQHILLYLTQHIYQPNQSL